MERKKTYEKRPTEEVEFDLRIPEGPAPRPQGGILDLRTSAGQQSFQQYAQHCLTGGGSEPTVAAFKAKFTAWSLEGVPGGMVLYPEGPAFKVLARHFMEGDEPVTYHAGVSYYTALMLCLHPTVFPSTGGNIPTPDEQYASYQITATFHSEPAGPVEVPVVSQKPIEVNGEIFTWKLNYYPNKVSLKIEIFPSPTGRNNIFLGGRMGTVLSVSI